LRSEDPAKLPSAASDEPALGNFLNPAVKSVRRPSILLRSALLRADDRDGWRGPTSEFFDEHAALPDAGELRLHPANIFITPQRASACAGSGI
jgi:hypothetical protein